ncbi:MAG: hypothetical protein ABIU63_09125 [Chitinophagaceae bacterium]
MFLIVQKAGAQLALLNSPQDTVDLLHHLVKEELLQQMTANPLKNKISPALKNINAATVDTLSDFLLQQLRQLGHTTLSAGNSIRTTAFQETKELLRRQITGLMQTQDIKNMFSQVTGMAKQPALAWEHGSVLITGQVAPVLLSEKSVVTNNTMVNSSWKVLGVPIILQLARQDLWGRDYYSRNNFSVQFDREAYLSSIKNAIRLKIRPADLLPDYNTVLTKIKASALSGLRSSLDSINASCKGMLTRQLQQLGDPENFFTAPEDLLRDKLLSPALLQDLDNKKNQLAQLQQQLNEGDDANKVLYDSLLGSIQVIGSVKAMLNKIESFKMAVRQNGLFEKLERANQFSEDGLREGLNDPDKIKALAKEQLNISGLQKFLLNISSLQLGLNVSDLSPLTMSQFTSSGVSASFTSNKSYVFFMAGKEKNYSSLYDRPFADNISFAAPGAAIGARIGRGALSATHAHLSLFSYKHSNNQYEERLASVVPGKTVVFTLSNQLKMNAANYFNLEVSSSKHSYDNQEHNTDSLLMGANDIKQITGQSDIVQRVAVTLQWTGEVEDKKLSYAVHGTHIGREYNNPGNMFLSRGTNELGASLKKTFSGEKLQLSARGNYRSYQYGAKSLNYQIYLQAKWKFNKGQYLAVSYQPVRSLRQDHHTTMGAIESNRLAVDANWRRRFHKNTYQHFVSLALLQNSYRADSILSANHSLLINSMQTVTRGDKSYYLNLQYNQSAGLANAAVFNTQFNAEAGCSYSLFKGLVASTAINYNSTKNWFQQAGIKLSMSGQFGENCMIGFYTWVVKNIKEQHPVNMDMMRLDWSIRYLLR